MMKNSRRTFKQWSAAFLTLCMLTAVVPAGAAEVEYISPGPGTSVPDGSVNTTPETYKFTVEGRGFVLLDNDESTYYVTTTDAYGDMETISGDNITDVSEPTDKQINYDAYKSDAFLNGDFLTKGNNFTSSGNDTTTYYKLPQGIIDNIDRNHVWKRFVNDTQYEARAPREYTTGVSLLSWTDFTTYAGKLGVRDVFNDPNVASTAGKYYYLRDSHAWGGNGAVLMFGDTGENSSVTVYGNQWGMKYGLLRPAFYLKKDFFKTTKVDLSTAGETVRMAILNACTETELSNLYTDDERSTYFGSKSPIKVTTDVRSGAALADVKLLDTLTASVSEGVATEYKWQTRTGEGDKWTEIDGATSKEYIVSAAQAGAQVSCAAKVDGVWIYSDAVQIPMYEAVVTGNEVAAPAETVNTTPATDKFVVNGKGFVLLDTFDNDESTYYVTTTDAYGDMQLKTDGEWWTLSGKEINYDAYNAIAFLNGDFLTKGNNFTALANDTTTYHKLPQGIIDNINQNHVWWRFVNDYRKQEGVKSTYQAGISFLSWTDFTTYAGKLGVKDGCLNSNVANADTYFLRDTNNWGGDTSLALFCTADNQCKHWGQNVRQYGFVRPAFYLKKDFFKNTKLDLNATGENVLAVMRNNYCIEDLSHLYSMQELYEKGFSPRNYAMKASMTYTGTDGGTLSGLNGAANVKAAVTIKSGKTEAKDAVLILKAVDSKNGLYISTKPVTVKANGETREEISLEELKNMTDECQIDVFLWENFSSLKPITERLTYGQSNSVK